MPVVNEVMHVGILQSVDTQEQQLERTYRKPGIPYDGILIARPQWTGPRDLTPLAKYLCTSCTGVWVRGGSAKERVCGKAGANIQIVYKAYSVSTNHCSKSSAVSCRQQMPIEGVILKRDLALFGNVCRLDDVLSKSSTETADHERSCQRQLVRGHQRSSSEIWPS